MGGVGSSNWELRDTESKACCADSQIVVKLIADKYIPERLNSGITQQSTTVRSESVRRIRVALPRGKTYERRMQQMHAPVAYWRRIDRLPAGDIARTLKVIKALLERGNELGNGGRVVLVVAVDDDNALVALLECVMESHAHLGTQFPRTSLGQQSPHTRLDEKLTIKRPVRTSPISDDDIDERCEWPHALKLRANSFALVDHENANAEPMSPVSNFSSLIRRHSDGVHDADTRINRHRPTGSPRSVRS